MKLIATAALLMTATIAHADSRIERLCGAGHENEMAGDGDVTSNPDGFFVASLSEQLSQGDPRLVLTNATGFYLCTRPLVTPASSANDVYRNTADRAVKYLFVPIVTMPKKPSS